MKKFDIEELPFAIEDVNCAKKYIKDGFKVIWFIPIIGLFAVEKSQYKITASPRMGLFAHNYLKASKPWGIIVIPLYFTMLALVIPVMPLIIRSITKTAIKMTNKWIETFEYTSNDKLMSIDEAEEKLFNENYSNLCALIKTGYKWYWFLPIIGFQIFGQFQSKANKTIVESKKMTNIFNMHRPKKMILFFVLFPIDLIFNYWPIMYFNKLKRIKSDIDNQSELPA